MNPIRIGASGFDITLYGHCVSAMASTANTTEVRQAHGDAAMARAFEIVTMYGAEFLTEMDRADAAIAMFWNAMHSARTEISG